MIEDGWPWTQDPDRVLLECNLRTKDQPVPAWVTFQGDANGWPKVVRIVIDAIAVEPVLGLQLPAGERIPNTPDDVTLTDIPIAGVTEDEAVALVREAFRRQRDYDETHKVLGILRGDVRPTHRVRRSLRDLSDQSVASAYRLIAADHHDACARLAYVLGATSDSVRSKVKRLRDKGLLGPATGTRVGEARPPRRPRKSRQA